MSVEELVEKLMDVGMKAYKSNRKTSSDARKLDRHEPIDLPSDGVTVTCWKEFVAYKMADWVQEVVPEATVTVELKGNDTILSLEISDEEQLILEREFGDFLAKWG